MSGYAVVCLTSAPCGRMGSLILACVAVIAVSTIVLVVSVVQLVRLPEWTGRRIRKRVNPWAPLRPGRRSRQRRHHYAKRRTRSSTNAMAHF